MSGSGKLIRAVGPLGLTAIAINGVVGGGIFVMPATVAGILGAASPIAYLAAGAAAALIVLCFAEAGGMFDRAGGPYVYAREAFGPFIGFQAGWMFQIGRVAGAAANANAFAAYLGFLDPALAAGTSRAAAITISLGAIGVMNYVGVRYGSWAVNLFTIGKLVPFAVFLAAGLAAADPTRFTLTAVPEFAPLRQASLILLFALGGFEFASVPSEEALNARRHLPYALIAGIACGAGIYVLVQIVCLGTLPELARAAAPVASAAERFLGPSGALLMTVGAILSTTGTNSSILLVGPRVFYALAQNGQFPRVFARVHPRFHTPHVSVAVFAIITWILALPGTFHELAAMNAIARLLYSITTCAAVPVLRARIPAAERGFTLPFGWLIPALGIAASVFLLTGATARQALLGGAGMAAGAVVYPLLTRESRSAGR